MSRFSSLLLNWYREHKRKLPWRGHADPYAIWVSEIMLQQTRVDAVLPYYARWMRRFPTIAALARSSEHEVLKLWEGLGYYARARNLRTAAIVVVQRYGGKIPRDPDSLRNLPGIGRYTAGAISSMAFGLDEPALDGNIRRVLSRVFDVDEPAASPESEKQLLQLAIKHLPKGAAGGYNQALMDLGATICIPRSPRCHVCPLRSLCKARKLGIQDQRPVRKSAKFAPHYTVAAAVITRRGRVLMARRPSDGLLGGMWEFPNGRVRGAPANGLHAALQKAYELDVESGELLGVVHHVYSHFGVSVHAYRCKSSSVPKRTNLRWILIGELDDFPMGKVDRLIARKLS
jgi:A/G-specific adenine glycosylase